MRKRLKIEDRLAHKLVASAAKRMDEEDEVSLAEVLLTRVKLEVRTWFLRASLGANVAALIFWLQR